MIHIVLAGGYWALSKKQDMGGFQVNPNDDRYKTVDYIVKIQGLPRDYFKVSTKEKRKYFCNTCKRSVSEWEMERREGCYTHPLKMDLIQEEDWPRYSFERYNPVKIPFLRTAPDCYRIWLDNGQGQQKWRDIWRYVTQTYPPNKRLVPDLLPVPLGNIMQLEISETDIPVIVLGPDEKIENKPEIKQEAKIEEPAKTVVQSGCSCEVCGKQFQSIKALNLHKMAVHKITKANPVGNLTREQAISAGIVSADDGDVSSETSTIGEGNDERQPDNNNADPNDRGVL